MSTAILGAGRSPKAATLQEFLVHLRSQLDPSALGFPAPSGRGRKPPKNREGLRGLTQPQAAQLSNLAAATYGRIERGEKEPTDEELEAIAEGLQLSEAKRSEMWVKAGRERLGLARDCPDGIQPHEFWVDLIPAIGQSERGPIAYLTDAGWNLRSCNLAYRALFPGGNPPENPMAWMLWDGIDQLPDHERSWRIPALTQLDQALTRHPSNRSLQDLMHRALADPETRKLLEANEHLDFRHPDGVVRPFVHAGTGERGSLAVAAAAPFGAPGSRFVLMDFTPDALSMQQP